VHKVCQNHLQAARTANKNHLAPMQNRRKTSASPDWKAEKAESALRNEFPPHLNAFELRP